MPLPVFQSTRSGESEKLFTSILIYYAGVGAYQIKMSPEEDLLLKIELVISYIK